jgi:predicted nucleic acid-binding protein
VISALDTNVLLDVLVPNEQFFERSLRAIQSAASGGSLVICDLVYAELCLEFNSASDCDSFLSENQIIVERVARQSMWTAASAWKAYRRVGGRRDRVLPDFLIGAHALCQATRLVTRDRGVYGKYFRGLKVIDPGSQ